MTSASLEKSSFSESINKKNEAQCISSRDTSNELTNASNSLDEKDLQKDYEEESVTSKEVIPRPGPPEYYEGWRLAVVQLSLNLILFIAALDIVIVTSAIEKISEEFHDYAKSGWIITGYSLPTSVCCLIWSRIAQRLGKRLSVAIAVVIFEAGSLIVALSNSMNMLIGGRVLAGIAGSGIQVLMFLVGATLVPEQKRPFVLSLLSFSFTVSSVVGPFIGGAFTNAPSGGVLSWRWCFYINLPIGFTALAVFYFAYDDHDTSILSIIRYWKANFKRDVKKLKTKNLYTKLMLELLVSFDMIGFISSAAGYILALLSFTFSNSDDYSWTSGLVIAFIVVGMLLIIFSFLFEYFLYSKLVGFLEQKYSGNEALAFNFKAAAPLFPKEAIRNIYIGCANATAVFVTMAYGFQANYVIQYFQLVFHQSAMKASINFIPFMVSISIVVFLSALVMSKTGAMKPFIILGGVAAVLGNALLSTMDGSSNEAKKIIYLIIAASAFGFVAQSTLLSSHLQLDKTDPMYMLKFAGVTGVNSFAKTMGISIGSVLSTMTFNFSVINKAKKLSPPVTITANTIVSYINGNYTSPTSTLSNMVSSSIHNVFYVSTAIAAVALILSLFTSNKRVMTSKKAKQIEKQEEEQDLDA